MRYKILIHFIKSDPPIWAVALNGWQKDINAKTRFKKLEHLEIDSYMTN